MKLFLQPLILGCAMSSGLLLSSCTKDDATSISEDSLNELHLGAAITGSTRATDAGFEVNDTIGIYITKWIDGATPDTLKANRNYTDNVFFYLESLSNNWLPEYSIYYPSDDHKIDLYAYYPYQTPAFSSGILLDIMVATNQSADNNYTRSDFMTAKATGISRTPDKVPLTFDHRLSQMVFILKPGTGFSVTDLLPAKVKIRNAIIDATFDLFNTITINGSTHSDIFPAGSWTAGSESLTGLKAIMIPQELNSNTYVEITLGSRRFTYKPVSVHLNPGCSRVFTITVNNTGLDITTEINPWDNCPPVNGDANEEFDPEPIVTMVTTKSNLKLYADYNSDILVDWGDNTIEKNIFKHNYTDGAASHEIKFYGSEEAITILSLGECQITYLDVKKNKALTKLMCETNQLTSIDVSNNKALTFLMLHTNQLTSLDVSNNTALKTLECNLNKLSNLDVSKNTELEWFICLGNQLTNLDISKNKKIYWLNCYANQLTSLDVSENIDLETLCFSENQINDIDLSNNTKLKALFCNDNQLTNLNVSKNLELTEIDCSKNQIKNLDVSLNTELSILRCFENQLINLDVSKNLALTRLFCGKNQLPSLDISKNTALNILSCGENQLTLLDISKNIALTTLDIKNSQIATLDISENNYLNYIYCIDTSLAADQTSLVAFANMLPDRTRTSTGDIRVNIGSKPWIKSICDTKNWKITTY